VATPARLVRIQCPRCGAGHWVVDNDYRGSALLGQRELDYDEREYTCPKCGERGAGFRVQIKTPVRLVLDHDWIFRLLAQALGAERER
jgi:predicted RNA-binding Zn-ribbon protein involved in translation (DUF1610 family)